MEKINRKRIKLGYCRITKTSTKFFFQKDGEEIEFYIQRDPETSTAEIAVNPGVSGAMPALVRELMDLYYEDLENFLMDRDTEEEKKLIMILLQAARRGYDNKGGLTTEDIHDLINKLQK